MTRIRDSSLWMRRQLCPGCTYIVAVTLRHDELHDGFYVSLYGQLVSHVGGHLSCDQWPAASMTTVTGDLSVDCRPSVRPSVRSSVIISLTSSRLLIQTRLRRHSTSVSVGHPHLLWRRPAQSVTGYKVVLSKYWPVWSSSARSIISCNRRGT